MPESGLTGLEICSLKSRLRFEFEDLQGNSLYFIFLSSSGYPNLTDAKCRQIHIKPVGVCSCFSVSGPSLLIIRPAGKIMITSWRENCQPNFQVECVGAAPLRRSSEPAGQWSSARLHWQGTGLWYQPQIFRSNSVIQDYFDILYELIRY